jgi:hypothetical protein
LTIAAMAWIAWLSTGQAHQRRCFIRLKFLLIASFFLAFVTGVKSDRAFAQTVAPWEEKILMDHCRDGKQLVALEHEADTHIGKDDPMDTYSAPLKAAAKLAYGCARTTKNEYAKDWYSFSFANDAFRGVTSADEAERVWPPMINILIVLTHSPHPDVRKAAQETLSLAKAAENKAGIH